MLPKPVLTDPDGVPTAGSLSTMKSVALVAAEFTVAPPVGLKRVSTTVRGRRLIIVSSVNGTENVRLVWPGAKERVPLTGVKSFAVAEPGVAE